MRADIALRRRKLYGLTWGTDLGGWRIALKGELGSEASRSGAGNSYCMVVGTVGFGVGFCRADDPLRLSHDRTSDTLDMRASCLGYLEEECCSVCQRMPSPSM
jgi:hypothetical protein